MKVKNNAKLLKLIAKFASVAFVFLLCFFVFIACNQSKQELSYLRLHVRAHSNSVADQNIKFMVKDALVDYLTPLVANVQSVEELKSLLQSKTSQMQNVSNAVLTQNGFNYKSEVKINNEFFPARYYDGLLLEASFYDALIVKLGSGQGDNWWCVVYPPLCFVDANPTGANFKYKSIFAEMISDFFG